VARSLRESPDEGVVYYACDLDRDPDAIRLVVQTAREAYPRYRRWRIFLDEITTVPDWPRAIKWLWDNTAARDDTFVLTGSSATDLWAGAAKRGRTAYCCRFPSVTSPAFMVSPHPLRPGPKTSCSLGSCRSSLLLRSDSVAFSGSWSATSGPEDSPWPSSTSTPPDR